MATETETAKVQSSDGELVTATQTKTVKPGYQTTEFYFTAIAMFLSMAYASGLIAPDGTSTAAKAVALAASALASMGYTVSRGLAKK